MVARGLLRVTPIGDGIFWKNVFKTRPAALGSGVWVKDHKQTNCKGLLVVKDAFSHSVIKAYTESNRNKDYWFYPAPKSPNTADFKQSQSSLRKLKTSFSSRPHSENNY